MRKLLIASIFALISGCSEEPKDDPQEPSEMGNLFSTGSQTGIDKSQGLIKSDEEVIQQAPAPTNKAAQ